MRISQQTTTFTPAPMIFNVISHILSWRDRLRGNRFLNIVIKSGVVVLLFAVLYRDLSENRNLPAVWETFVAHLEGARWGLLALVVLLMPFNWLAETEKWRQFVARYQPFSRIKAILAVMTGVTFSLFTPNRVGEYGGRMLYVQPEHQWKAVVANLVGNFCQYMVLLGGGVAGGLYIIHHFHLIDITTGYVMVILAGLGFLVMLGIYYYLEFVIDFIKHRGLLRPIWPWIGRLQLGVIRQFTRQERLGILGWAIVRYFIYATQYFLLLRFFWHSDRYFKRFCRYCRVVFITNQYSASSFGRIGSPRQYGCITLGAIRRQ